MSEVAAPIELEETRLNDTLGDPLIARNLALLGHVSVDLDVHLGSAEVTVERLFSLAKGDTLALDTELDSPVTLRLDGKPIARGHLMAIGDRFGLKISEIL